MEDGKTFNNQHSTREKRNAESGNLFLNTKHTKYTRNTGAGFHNKGTKGAKGEHVRCTGIGH